MSIKSALQKTKTNQSAGAVVTGLLEWQKGILKLGLGNSNLGNA
jgi:hypothetical protein